MDRYERLIKTFLVGFLVAVLVFVFYTGAVNWGKIEIAPASTITVTGTSKLDQAPQVANFNATVSIDDDDKDTAVNSVNTKMTALINSLKTFGIAESDIQTSQVSVYENNKAEILIYPPRPTTTKAWQASNSITIKLRDINKASALTDLLNTSGATQVSGPNFTIEDTKSSDSALLVDAISDAKTKADAMAKAGGRRLGKMITVTEGYSSQPFYAAASLEKALDSRGVPSPVEPGTQTLSKTVTVIFELR